MAAAQHIVPIMSWLFDIVYVLAVVLGSPLWLARMIRYGKYRRDWKQRLGLIPRRWGLQPVLWVHGVSVGEVGAARSLVAQLHAQLPDYQVVASSTTDTGLAAARRHFEPDHVVFRWPLDLSACVSVALGRLRPAAVILMEGDVWPNFTAICRRRGIPVVVVNGRIGPRKGYPRYRLIRPLAAWLFNSLEAIGVQHEAYADLFRALGVRNDRLHVTGMMKFDTAEVGSAVAGQEQLAAALGIVPADRLIVAGGTGAGEERLVLEAFSRLRRAGPWPNLKLAIVPRKPERFDEVARLIQASGFELVRRSRQGSTASAVPPPEAVILGDTMGELRKFYALARAAFVGRSLVPEGGSDMIEAAALGKCVCFGPHTFNFPQAQSMVEAGAARRVESPAELASVLAQWLQDPSGADEMGRRAQQYVRSQQGATARNVALICRILGREYSTDGGIATDAIETHPA